MLAGILSFTTIVCVALFPVEEYDQNDYENNVIYETIYENNTIYQNNTENYEGVSYVLERKLLLCWETMKFCLPIFENDITVKININDEYYTGSDGSDGVNFSIVNDDEEVLISHVGFEFDVEYVFETVGVYELWIENIFITNNHNSYLSGYYITYKI